MDLRNAMQVAEKMAIMLNGDSAIPVDMSRERIGMALMADGVEPTLYEMECMVYGGPLDAQVDEEHPDTGGEGNPDVDQKFPQTVLVISSFF